jgi:hypothetical protein
MNAEAFTSNHSACPLCASGLHLGRFQGQLICPYCNSRLVVSIDGQFVRDPFSRQQLVSTQKLRRQSSPIARLGRDVQPPVKLLLGGLLLCAIVGTAWVKLGSHMGMNPSARSEQRTTWAPP